jgi:hypothetical protein
MGVYCSNERVLCPDYSHGSSFADNDLTSLENVITLFDVDFTGSQVSRAAAFRFFESHPGCSIAYDSVCYMPERR